MIIENYTIFSDYLSCLSLSEFDFFLLLRHLHRSHVTFILALHFILERIKNILVVDRRCFERSRNQMQLRTIGEWESNTNRTHTHTHTHTHARAHVTARVYIFTYIYNKRISKIRPSSAAPIAVRFPTFATRVTRSLLLRFSMAAKIGRGSMR